MPSNWRSPPRPRKKFLEQGRFYNREQREVSRKARGWRKGSYEQRTGVTSGEQRDPAVNNLLTTLGGWDEMIKSSIILQDLRRKIYLKAKSDSTGTGGVGPGFTILWDCFMIMEFVTIKPESAASLIGLITLQLKLTE
jgi:hypothetical protein